MSAKRNTTRRTKRCSDARASRIETRNEIAKMKTLEVANKVASLISPAIQEYIDSKLDPIIEEFKSLTARLADQEAESTTPTTGGNADTANTTGDRGKDACNEA